MRLRPDLVLLPLDDDAVVFSEEAQSLIGLNATAAFVVRKLQDGTPASELAQALVCEGLAAPDEATRWVTATLDALGSHHILADSLPVPMQTPNENEHRARLITRMPPYATFEPVAERRYRLLNTRAVIRFAILEQVTWVDAVIGHLATDDTASPTIAIDIQGVALDDGRVRSYVYLDGAPTGFATRLYRLGPVVKDALWHRAVNAHDFLFNIHAGVVGAGDACVLLPAASGSGKSSLTAALLHSGFRYFSDEVALLEAGTFQVPAVPLALCVKSTGWDVIARYFPEISTLPIHERGDGKLVRYLARLAGRLPIQQASAPVSHIIFPRYDKAGPTELKPIGRIEALRRLMDECLALRRRLDLGTVRDLVGWFAGIDCYALTFLSLDEAVSAIKQVVRPAVGFSYTNDARHDRACCSR
jgi:hypothetical protein